MFHLIPKLNNKLTAEQVHNIMSASGVFAVWDRTVLLLNLLWRRDGVCFQCGLGNYLISAVGLMSHPAHKYVCECMRELTSVCATLG